VPAHHNEFEVFYSKYKKDLNKVEKRAFEIIQTLKGVILKNNLRQRNEGDTEWVYTGLKEVNQCFQMLKAELEADPYYSNRYNFRLEETNTLDLDSWITEMHKHKSDNIVKQELLFNMGNNSFIKPKK
jgi:hypothetical protein